MNLQNKHARVINMQNHLVLAFVREYETAHDGPLGHQVVVRVMSDVGTEHEDTLSFRYGPGPSKTREERRARESKTLKRARRALLETRNIVLVGEKLIRDADQVMKEYKCSHSSTRLEGESYICNECGHEENTY